MKQYDVVVCGGGAAGFFAAINIAEANTNLKIAILERGSQVLEKVRISGGGRCNVMHACFDPTLLTTHYPRGEKELRGPFHKFGSSATQAWFNKHGVSLKVEADGRMFPESNSSQTIINCFLAATKKLGVDICTQTTVQKVTAEPDSWVVTTQKDIFRSKYLLMATGSNPKIWAMLAELGHTIIGGVPSLFTFNIKDDRIANLQGISALATIAVDGYPFSTTGPVLVTHWGLSGPAILKLSAWAARFLHEKNYHFTIQVNWLIDVNQTTVYEFLLQTKIAQAKKNIGSKAPVELPARLWHNLLASASIEPSKKWADLSKLALQQLGTVLTETSFKVNGKSTFKEEFVTAGGIDLREVNFKTMESKLHKNLFFAGEMLNIDAITGGFNFQNAWTSAFIAATSMSAH